MIKIVFLRAKLGSECVTPSESLLFVLLAEDVATVKAARIRGRDEG